MEAITHDLKVIKASCEYSLAFAGKIKCEYPLVFVSYENRLSPVSLKLCINNVNNSMIKEYFWLLLDMTSMRYVN